MPEIKIKHVVSFSSEDKVHKAENMLKSETYRKWKCATPGEKNASILLQFEKATKIHSIDIGNESSAFVEVLVGRSSDSVGEYQVLLVASSFMSPLESRNGTHTNRVRMFDNDKLSHNLKEEKWDCVQVVCTQPFNKNISYGLSFIKFLSPPEKHVERQPESETKTATTKPKLGAFELKYEDGEDNESSPPVGNSWLQNKNSSFTTTSPTSSQEAPSYAAAVLASTSQEKPQRSSLSEYERKVLKNKQDHQNVIKALKIKEAEEGFATAVKELKGRTDTENKRSPSLQLPLREKHKRLNVPKVNPLKRSPDANEELPGKPPRKKELVQGASTSNHSNKVAKDEKKRRPLNKIMDNVVFALSGFVNPLRGEIRDKALEMGARYKGDWDRTCTHLVCAFINTPKYIQVRGADGRIVTKEWILECYKKKTLLPWRSYMLGKYSKSSSEEESESEVEEVLPRVKNGTPKANGKDSRDQTLVGKRRARFVSSSDSDSAEEKTRPSNQPKSLFGDEDLSDEKPTPSSQPKSNPKSLFLDEDLSDDKPASSSRPKSLFGEEDSSGKKSTPSSQPKSKNKSLFRGEDSSDEKLASSSQPKSLFGDDHNLSGAAKDESETEDEDALQDYMAATDVESDSGGDTEDEIRKVEEKAKRKKKVAEIEQSVPSDEDSESLLVSKPDTTDLPLPELPNLFKKRHFFLYGEFSSKARHDLQRFITAYNGVIDDYMCDTVKYVVTEAGWDKNFEDALEENEDLIFVKPKWIFKCHAAEKLVPYQAYIVIPN